jgi:hypothetical protein
VRARCRVFGMIKECGTVYIFTTVALNVKWPVMQNITNSGVIKCNHYEI